MGGARGYLVLVTNIEIEKIGSSNIQYSTKNESVKHSVKNTWLLSILVCVVGSTPYNIVAYI